MSENLRSLRNLDVGDEEDKALFTVEPRHSVMMEKVLTPERINELDLTDHQKAMLRDAVRIFTTFLEDGAPHWTFVDPKVVDEIRNGLKSGQAVDINVFSKAQAQVYATMQTDTFPRFIKAILANPEKFSTGERFELPEDLKEHLTHVASQHEVLDRDAVVAQLAQDVDAGLVFTSPRISSRHMSAVPE